MPFQAIALHLTEPIHRHFELFWPRTNLSLNLRKPENNTLLTLKNTKEIILNLKGKRMVKDGED